MQAAATRLLPSSILPHHPHPRVRPGARTGGRAVGIQGRRAGSRAAGHLEVCEHHRSNRCNRNRRHIRTGTDRGGGRRTAGAEQLRAPRRREAARRESTGRRCAAAATALNSATNWRINSIQSIKIEGLKSPKNILSDVEPNANRFDRRHLSPAAAGTRNPSGPSQSTGDWELLENQNQDQD